MRLLHDAPVYASLEEVRTIWAAVSKDQCVTIRKLVAQTGIGKTKISHILKLLKASGYISRDRYGRAYRVSIPLAAGTLVHGVNWTALQSKPITESVTEQSKPDAPDAQHPRINWDRAKSINNARQSVSELRQKQNQRNEEHRQKAGS